jgi:hypothetical protein
MATKKSPPKAAPIAPLPKADTPKAAPAPKSETRYALTGKEYKPKAIQNRASWQTVKSLLEKGPATLAELHKALQYGQDYLNALDPEDQTRWPAKYKEAHTDFIGYLMKGPDPAKHYLKRI